MLRAAFLGTISAIAVALAIACTTSATLDGGATPCSSVPSSPSSGPDPALCVLPMLAKGIKTPWGQTLSGAAASCGVTSEQAQTLWNAHTQAEVLEGFVPKAVGTDAASN